MTTAHRPVRLLGDDRPALRIVATAAVAAAGLAATLMLLPHATGSVAEDSAASPAAIGSPLPAFAADPSATVPSAASVFSGGSETAEDTPVATF